MFFLNPRITIVPWWLVDVLSPSFCSVSSRNPNSWKRWLTSSSLKSKWEWSALSYNMILGCVPNQHFGMGEMMMNHGMEWVSLFSDKHTMIQGARFARKRTYTETPSPHSCHRLVSRSIVFRGSYSCPGFFDDESKSFKRCKAWWVWCPSLLLEG